jgi:hypothetical protein
MTTRFWPLLTIAGGLATLGVFVGFNFMPAVSTVYSQGTVGDAVSLFQRAETVADIAAVFGEPPSAAIIAAQDAINRLDLYGFIPAYTLFLVAGAAVLAGGVRKPLAWAAIAPALVGAGADVVETLQQLRLTADMSNAAAHLPIAPAHWVKYAALGANGFGVAAIALLGARKRQVLAVLALAPLPCVLTVWAGFADDTRLFSAAFGFYWVALLVLAIMEMVRAKGGSA